MWHENSRFLYHGKLIIIEEDKSDEIGALKLANPILRAIVDGVNISDTVPLNSINPAIFIDSVKEYIDNNP